MPITPARDEATSSPAELITRVRAREAAALASLYDHTVGQVYALALAMLRSREDAEELVVDVYERAWNDAHRYDSSRGTVIAWLLIMCRSRALDLLRQRAARGRTLASLAAEPQDDGHESPRSAAEADERNQILGVALEQLSPVRRQLISLAFFEDLSQQEIALRLRMPLGTVKSHLRRGMLELRDALGSGELNHEA